MHTNERASRRQRHELARRRHRLINTIRSTGSQTVRDELIILGQQAGLL